MNPILAAQGLLPNEAIDDIQQQLEFRRYTDADTNQAVVMLLCAQAKLANSRATESSDVVLKSVRSKDMRLLANFYDYDYFDKVMKATEPTPAPAHEGEPEEPRIEKSDDNACIGCPNTEYVWRKDFLAWQTYTRALAAEVGRLKCYEKAWREWRSLQTGDATKMMDAAIRCDAAEAALSAKGAEVATLKKELEHAKK